MGLSCEKAKEKAKHIVAKGRKKEKRKEEEKKRTSVEGTKTAA